MFVETTNAANEVSPLFTNNMEFGDFVLLVISLFVLFSGLFSIIFILYGGLLLVLSGGKDDKIKPAINTIRYAILGLIITIVSIFAFPILGSLLGIDVETYANPQAILGRIQQIGNDVFGATSSEYGSIGAGDGSSNGNLPSSVDTIPDDFSDL